MGGEREQKPERRPLRDWKATVFRFDGEQFDELIEALSSRGEGHSDLPVLTAIGQLTEKMEGFAMGLKEDNEALGVQLGNVESAVTAVAEDIAALKVELEEANERANIDLSPQIARATTIEAGLRSAVGAGPGSDPASPPPEP